MYDSQYVLRLTAQSTPSELHLNYTWNYIRFCGSSGRRPVGVAGRRSFEVGG